MTNISDIFHIPEFRLPDIEMPEMEPGPFFAYQMHESLQARIKEVEEGLADDEEFVLLHVAPDGRHMRVTEIAFYDPHLFELRGKDTEGKRFSVLTHFRSVYLQMWVQKLATSFPIERSRIGFEYHQKKQADNHKTDAGEK